MSSHSDSFVASGNSPTDLIFENHGSLFLIRPVSQTGSKRYISERNKQGWRCKHEYSRTDNSVPRS